MRRYSRGKYNHCLIGYLEILITDFNKRFFDLKALEFPSGLTQPLLADLSAISEQCQQELCELQQDKSMKTLCKIKGTMMWLSAECEKKYFRSCTLARQKLTSFPSSCLVECDFSVVADLLNAERNQKSIKKKSPNVVI